MGEDMYADFTNEERNYVLDEGAYGAFVEYAKRWQKAFGLFDWCIEFAFGDKDEFPALDGNKAIAAMNRNGMVATIILNKHWTLCEPTDEELSRCALHEIIECLLRPLVVLAEARFNVDEQDMEYETHRIIRRLENFVTDWSGLD